MTTANKIGQFWNTLTLARSLGCWARRARFSSVLLLLAAMMVPVTSSFAATSLLSPEAKRDLELRPGVVLIKVSFEATLGGFTCPAGSSGTGFLYRPDGYLITNGHVAQWARFDDRRADDARMKMAIPCLAKRVIKDAQNRLGRELTEDERDLRLAEIANAIKAGGVRIHGDPKIEVVLDNGTTYEGEIKAYSDPITENGKDIAIIKIDGRNLPTVALGNSSEVNVGDPITVIGYPALANISDDSSLVPTVTNGRISAIKKQDYKGTPVLQSEATINPGNSGGPGFDVNGRVIGIATFTTGGPGLNFFVPIDTALEFVRQAGSAPERGPFDTVWLAALDAYSDQHWSKAHELMGTVLEMFPGQPDAKRLQLQAGGNLPTNPVARMIDSLGMPLVIGIGAGALLLVVILVWLMRKPSRKAVPASSPAVAYVAQPAVIQSPEPPVARSFAPSQAAGSDTGNYGSLQIANGPLAGNRFVIPKNGLLIGRDPSRCAVVLPMDSVSKEHAWVVPLDNSVAVIDRNSVNGTYLNSADSPRINKVTIKDGDRIFIGRTNPTEITYFSS
jgi:serine protease Do